MNAIKSQKQFLIKHYPYWIIILQLYYFDMIQVIMFYVMVESLYFSSLILHANQIIVRTWRIRKNLSLLLIIFSISTCNCNSVTLTLEHLSYILSIRDLNNKVDRWLAFIIVFVRLKLGWSITVPFNQELLQHSFP